MSEIDFEDDQYYVRCSCGHEHNTDVVKFLNVEEDIQGRDVVTFTCPIQGYEVRSLVFKGHR